MTTLIAVYNNDGCKGRCDARCYEACEPHCDCVCGGRNHGAGLERAVENTRELANEWMETFTQQHHIETPRWEVHALAPVQFDLFETLGV